MYNQAIVNSFSGHGPFCFNFPKHEQYTIFDLKKKLESVTFVHAQEQKIKTMGGRMLQDQDILFQDCKPTIFNLTVSMVGGLQRKLSLETRSVEQPTKRIRTEHKPFVCYTPLILKEDKGKQKQSRKRKYADNV